MVHTLERFALPLALAALMVGSARIVATYPVLSHTADEPGHLACGMHYLDGEICAAESAPLPRVFMAVGPRMAGARSYHAPTTPEEGLGTLYDRYHLYLSLARFGILPFFWLAGGVVFLCGTLLHVRLTGALAVLFFSLTPTILAHAGLATTDMALVACLGGAFLSGLIWAERPTVRTSLLWGALSGFAVLAKFSALGFLPATFLVALIWYLLAERPNRASFARLVRQRAIPFAIAMATAAMVLWSGFQFSYGPPQGLSFRVPAPELVSAVKMIAEANQTTGQRAYLFGEVSETGWWYYYPAALMVKTPLPLILLTAYGAVIALRRGKAAAPLAFALGILVVVAFSHYNIGVRHVLPVYLAFALLAAMGAIDLLGRSRTWRTLLAALLAWLLWTGAAKHPDYLAYFNELVQGPPENVLVDSDLDWGQDLDRLARRLQQLNAGEVRFNLFFDADLARQGFPPVKPVDPLTPSPGWTAVSPTWWKLGRPSVMLATGRGDFWIDHTTPVERVGSILLFHFGPAHQ